MLHPTESTADLLMLCREGNKGARDRLMRRFLPILRRWAHGRLPHHARSGAGTDDLVQLTLLKSIQHIDTFVPEREGAFLAYLRASFLNQMRDELRRSSRRPQGNPLEEHLGPAGPGSPLQDAVGQEALDVYEEALAQLTPLDREAVLMRLEFGYQYGEIAADLGLSSAGAARMRISRAVARLAKLIDANDLKA